MYRENAAPSAERLEALVAEIRPMAGALAGDFFELDEHRDLRPVLTEVLETEGKTLSAGELTHFLAVADQLRARLHDATANLAALRTSLDAVPEGFPPFRPSAKGFLQALFDPIFRLGDVSRVEDVKKTLRRKWNVEFASSAIVGGEEAWFEMMLPGDEGEPLIPVLLHARCVSSASDPRVTLRSARFQMLLCRGAPELTIAPVTAEDTLEMASLLDGEERPPVVDRVVDSALLVDGDREQLRRLFGTASSDISGGTLTGASRSLRRAALRLASQQGFSVRTTSGLAEIAFERLDLLAGIPDVFEALGALRRLRSRYLLLR